MERSDYALEAAAQSWVGTPFVDNSSHKGRGVCCHRLMQAVYHEAGWLPAVSVPEGNARLARFSNVSPMLEWMRGAGAEFFEPVLRLDDLQHGDLCLFKTGHVANHMGLFLQDSRILHVTAKQGVLIVPAIEKWRALLANIFRPTP